MNKKMVIRILGVVMGLEAALLIVPFIVGIIYNEPSTVHFLYASIICFVLYLSLSIIQVTKKVIYAK